MSQRVLIIDDEGNVRRMMRLALESDGYEVEDAADGTTGLDVYGDGSRFDAVLVDQHMPGMSGLEALRQIRERMPGATVIMVTAFGSIDLAVEAMKAGARDFLRKPLTPALLRDALLAALSNQQVTRQERRPPDAPLPPPLLSGAGEVWTVNGFFIRSMPTPALPSPNEHRFVVRHARTGPQGEVIVVIDPREVSRVARVTGRQLPANNTFWRQQAERALMSHLFREMSLPQGKRLMVDRVSDDALLLARDWRKE